MPETAAPARRHATSARRAVYLLVFALGVLPVASDLTSAHGLLGITQYDDGVYFAASLRLVAGILPYRDFVLVQPPGIALVLAPFAALGHLIGERHALGGARIFTAVVVGLNAVMVAYLLRRRGLVAMLLGGVALAVYPTAYAADHTFLLEPFCVACCLVGCCLVFDGESIASPRRCAAAGVALAAGGAVKTFAIVPVVVVVVVLVVVDRRKLGYLLVGLVLATLVLVGPFFLAAPHAFIHEVISSQVGRSTGRPTPLVDRVFALVGLAYASPALTVPGQPAVPAGDAPTVIAGLVVLGLIVLLGLFQLRRSERSAFGVAVVLLALGSVAISLIPAAYYDHYADFSAPFLALGVAAGATQGAAGLRRVIGSIGHLDRATVAVSALSMLVILGLGAVALVASLGEDRSLVDHFGDEGPAVAAVVPPGTCVLSDAESVLVSAGRAGPGPRGCPNIIDATGTWLTYDPLHPPVRSGKGEKDPALVALWAAAFRRADYVVLSGKVAFRIPWTTALRAEFEARFVQVPGTTALVYERRRS